MLPKRFNQCLDLIRNGNLQGIEEIYYEYYQLMFHVALKKVKAKEAAEDVASSFLIYLLENASEIPHIENPTAWICKIINNRAIDYVRKESKIIDMEDDEELFVTEDNGYINQMFIEVMNELTEYEQNLTQLHYMNGLKYKEISKIVKKSVGSVKMTIGRIKKKLLSFEKSS